MERHHERHRGPTVPRLRHVEGEPAAGIALVLRVEHAHPSLVVPEGGVSQASDEGVVVSSRRLEEPAAHRVERGGERIERLLDPGEAAERTVEPDDVARRSRGFDKGSHEVDRLARGAGEPLPHDAELVRALDRLEGLERCPESVCLGRERLGETRGHRRVEMPLHPSHAVERPQER